MQIRSLRAPLALALGFLAARAAVAHDTWLLPERFVLTKPKTIVCEMTSGMRFPRLESAIERSRVERAELRFRGTLSTIEERRSETHALAFLLPLRGPGVATVAVALKPRTLELTPAQVGEYLTEIGAPEAVRAAWAASPGKVWRETYRKLAKTVVRVGDGEDSSWSEPVGLPFELVPEGDPTRLAKGQTLAVRLLRDGKPRAGLAVGVLRAGEAAGVLLTSDADGRVTASFPRRGRYLLRSTELLPEGAGGDAWTSDFTTLTVDVR